MHYLLIETRCSCRDVGEAILVGSLRPIRTARETLGGRTVERPSCGGFVTTGETTLLPAYSATSKISLTSSARLDNEPNGMAVGPTTQWGPVARSDTVQNEGLLDSEATCSNSIVSGSSSYNTQTYAYEENSLVASNLVFNNYFGAGTSGTIKTVPTTKLGTFSSPSLPSSPKTNSRNRDRRTCWCRSNIGMFE